MREPTSTAKHRLAVIELAKTLGNVAEACRRSNIDRTSFYEWKRRYEQLGMDGLEDRPSTPGPHPLAVPPEIISQIKSLALKHPSFGCDRLVTLLPPTQSSVSAVTAQKILNKAGLGTSHDRWIALDTPNLDWTALSKEQRDFLLRMNPCLRERHLIGSNPGNTIAGGIFPFARLPSVGQLYVHALVDTFSNGCQMSFSQSLGAESMGYSMMTSFVLYWNEERGLGTYILGPHHKNLAISRRLTSGDVYLPRTPGFVERFRRIILTEFKPTLLADPPASLEDAWHRLAKWSYDYNDKRPSPGMPCFGRTPADVARQYVSKLR